jgi:hypothetical protein
MDGSEILNFLAENRFLIAAILIAAWAVWAAYYIHQKRKAAKPVFAAMPIPAAAPPERRAVLAETELKRLQKENERLTLALADFERKELRRDIERTAEAKIKAMLPEKLWLLDPENQPTGRPIYYIGGIPVIEKSAEIERLIDASPTFRFLSKLMPDATRRLVDRLYFQGDTLYFYTAQLLPSGEWAITALSKPPKKTGKHVKIPAMAKPYMLLTAKQQTLDQLIANRWEVTNAKAAITLAATILGPFPLDLYSQFKTNTGWEKYYEQ